MKNSNALVDAEWLNSNLDNENVHIIEIDVSGESYAEGHIPGTILWNIYSDIKYENTLLKDLSIIEDLIQDSGITPESTVVFYGYAPAFGYWLMSLLGHSILHVLDMNKETWKNKNYPMTTTVPSFDKGDFEIKTVDSTLQATHSEVVGVLDSDGHKILDVRSKLEYYGERFWPSGGIPDGARAGHIPSAVHIPVDGIVKDDGSFMNAKELETMFADVGMDQGEDIITYCTIGARASTEWFGLSQILGHENVRVYDDSWARWGMDPSTDIS